MHNQQLLILHWCSCLGSSDIVSCILEERGGLYLEYVLMSLHGHWIIHNTSPTNVHAPLSLNLGGSDIVCSIFASRGGLHTHYGFMLLHSRSISEDERPNIVEAVLMHLFTMGQWTCHLLFFWLKMANPCALERCNYAAHWLQIVKDQTSSTLCWCSPPTHLKSHLCAIIGLKIHIIIIDNQYIVSMYNQLNWNTL